MNSYLQKRKDLKFSLSWHSSKCLSAEDLIFATSELLENGIPPPTLTPPSGFLPHRSPALLHQQAGPSGIHLWFRPLAHVLWLNIESGNPYNVKVFLTHISV